MSKTGDTLDEIAKELDVIEAALDVTEGAQQAVNGVGVLARRSKIGLSIGIAVGAAAGASIAWFVAKRHYKFKYEELATQEIAEARALYNRLSKGELTFPQVEHIDELSETGERAAEALLSYGSEGLKEKVVVEERIEVVSEPVRKNVFNEQIPEEDLWDQDREEAYRATIGVDEPYIICDKEYLENENDYEQHALTYYVEDGVLIEDGEQPIELIDKIVGEENLQHFGKGTMSNHVVLVRNDKLAMDFEITRNEGSYAKEVLGFQHSDHAQRLRKPNRRPLDVDEE